MTQAYFALGLGLGTQNRKGEWLDTFYPQPLLAPTAKMVDAVLSVIEPVQGNTASAVSKDQMAQIAEALKAAGNKDQAELAVQLASGSQPLVVTLLATDDAPSSVPEGYLKLHLLSHRLVKPHSINLTGLFGMGMRQSF